MSGNVITAAVLCGGLGTRLRPVMGESLPKCLAPVAGRPFLFYLLDQLVNQEIQKVVLCIGHGGGLIARWAEKQGSQYKKLNLLLSSEIVPLGTGGALRNALPLLDSDPVLVLNGDTYLRFNLGKILPAMVGKFFQATVVQSVLNWEVPIRKTNAGAYLLSRKFLENLPEGKSHLEDELAKLPQKQLLNYTVDWPFLDIGEPSSYAKAEEFLRREGALK